MLVIFFEYLAIVHSVANNLFANIAIRNTKEFYRSARPPRNAHSVENNVMRAEKCVQRNRWWNFALFLYSSTLRVIVEVKFFIPV